MNKKTNKKENEIRKSFLDTLQSKHFHIIAFVLILIPAIIICAPLLFENLEPIGEDSVASSGSTKLYLDYQNETGETVLWNPSIFGGMPTYHRLTIPIFHVDYILGKLGMISHWSFWYFLAGGIGFYLFLLYRKIPWYIALIPAVMFVILPDWQALIGSGHNVKFRALMVIPWLILSFNLLVDKKSWLSAGFFTLMFSWMVRTQHYQIIFYGILILFVLFIYPYIKMIINKEYKDVINLGAKFVLAICFTIIIAAQPFFSVKEYTPYSTRGGNPVKMTEEANTAEKSGGVSFDYATQWSLSPAEVLDFFGPRIHGGYQGERYDGDKYPQVKGQMIRGYWGEKPMNGNYSFIGIILFLLAIIGVYFYRKDKFIIATSIFVVFTVLLGFGRHFPDLYKLMFYYVPYFSKFRAPGMITNVSFIGLLILAAYGLKGLTEKYEAKDLKPVLGILGAGVLFSFALYLMADSFSFAAADDSRYGANGAAIFKGIRKEFFLADVKKIIFFSIGILAIVFLFVKKIIKKEVFVGLVLVLAFIEVFAVTNLAKSNMQLNNRDQLERNVFKETQVTRILKNAEPGYRAIGLGNELTKNDYSYFYPTISGYSAIKMQVIQDVITNNLYKGQSQSGINWNIINMLGGKYVIVPARLNQPFLRLAAVDKGPNVQLYENESALPKAWFVNKIIYFDQPRDIINGMNKAAFNPKETALVLKDNNLGTDSLTAEGKVQVTSSTPNKIELSAESTSEQFLVLSEIYYPQGWIAKVNGEETEIVKVNHLLRGIKLPAGKNTISFEFHPTTYYASYTIVWIGFLVVILVMAVGYYFEKKKVGDK